MSPDGRRIVSGSDRPDRGGLGPRHRQPIHRLTGHQDCGEFRGGEPRRATHRLGVARQHRGGLGPRNRHANPPAHRASRSGEFRGGEPRRATHRLGVSVTTPWRSGTSKPARQSDRLTGHQGWVSSVAVSPDGRRIVSGSHDKTVVVWDLESGTPIHRLTGHQDCGEFRGGEPRRPTHRLGVWDKTVAVWDLETGDANPPAHRASRLR